MEKMGVEEEMKKTGEEEEEEEEKEKLKKKFDEDEKHEKRWEHLDDNKGMQGVVLDRDGDGDWGKDNYMDENKPPAYEE